jgi:thiol-disulfide isomerase/thioredoxin
MIDKAAARQYERAMRNRTIYLLGAICLALAFSLAPGGRAGAAAVQEANSGRGGETLDLQSLRVKGKTTLIEFYSPFCPPCLRLAPLLAALAQKRRDMAIKKVNINRPAVKGIDWRSPLAQQYKIRMVPYFMIFSPRGKGIEGQAASRQVENWLVEAGIVEK